MLFQKQHAIGGRPGQLVVNESLPSPKIGVIKFSETEYERFAVQDPAELKDHLPEKGLIWIDVQGLGDEKVIRQIFDDFAIHPLAGSDIINTPQRPKAEPYDEQFLLISRMAMMPESVEKPIDFNEVIFEQVSIVFGENFVLTFQEKYGDVLDPIRKRIKSGKPTFPIRSNGSDYLAYAIYDTIVDGYYPMLEFVGEKMEQLEDEIIKSPDSEDLNELHKMKKFLIQLRRAIWPQREAINSLIRSNHPLLNERTNIFFRDTYDHCVQISEVAEMQRETASGLLNIYLSVIANRQNEIMKALTITATIFIPLTFFAGIYGMNFDYMPETKWRYSYPTLIGLMILMTTVMVYFFHRKGWIFQRD